MGLSIIVILMVVVTIIMVYTTNQDDVYVVTAHRWGDSESHNYIVGVFSSIDRANEEAVECEEERGGKYECRISCVRINKGGGHRMVIKKIWDDHPENYLKKYESD